jgi:hypothetical protein
MLRRTAIVMIGCWTAFASRAAHAQSAVFPAPSASSRELTIAGGVTHAARSDQVVSPSIFGGLGVDGLVRARVPLFGLDATTSLTGGIRSLSSSASTHENLYEGQLRFDLMQREAAQHSVFRPALGIGTQFDLAVTDHHYGNEAFGQKAFVYGMAAIGPVARWDAPLGNGHASLQLGLPVAGVVIHPYSAIRAGHPLWEPKNVTLAGLQAPELGITYTKPLDNRVSLFTGYRAKMTRYDGELPVRGFNQSLLFGITLGGGRK